MAKPCPCGCGRDLGWNDRRIAKNGVVVQRQLDALEENVRPVADRSEVGMDNYPEFIREGEFFRDEVYAVAHGEGDAADFMRMHRADMNRWVKTADRAVEYVIDNVD